MPGFIPEHKIAEIQRSVDIVDLISGYMPLTRSGARYKALCPFHHEKTPSFMVSPDKQIFKCFGCGEGGDVFKFVMKKERVEFPEAVRMLAERAGIELVFDGGDGAREEKSALYEANSWAAAFFHKNLKESAEASFAREYLGRRRINEPMIEKFQLGYAPPKFKAFVEAAAQAKIALATLEKAGLVRRRGGDGDPALQFRNRLIFPIRDGRGRVAAFGARALSDEDMPKYLNSPETPVFSKSRTLYGISEAKEAILKERRVAIMEGYTDVIMAHQFGIAWAVAVLGTALTADHLRELKRYADEVVLVFDSDSAGRKSSDRSLDIFVEEDIPVRIATLAEGEDPCDFLLNRGADPFRDALGRGQDLISYKMDAALAGLRDAAPWQRAQALDDVLGTIARTPNPVTSDLLVKQVAERSGVSESAIRDRLARLRPYEGPKGRAETAAPAEGGPPTALEKAQREALQSLLGDNALIAAFAGETNAESFLAHFADGAYRKVAECVINVYRERGRATEQDVLERLAEPELRDLVAQAADLEPTKKNYERQLAGALEFLRKTRANGHVAELKARVAASDPRQVSDALLAEFLEKARQTRKGAKPYRQPEAKS